MGIGTRSGLLLPAEESYEGRHDRGGVAQALDGGVRALLEVVVVARHVEGGEGRPAALHAPGQGAGRQRHGQPAVGGQRALDGVRQGGRAGAHGRQGLWVLEAREARGGGDPGAQGQVVGGGERRACGTEHGEPGHAAAGLKSPRAVRPRSCLTSAVSVLGQVLLVTGVGPDRRPGVGVFVDQILNTFPAAKAKERAPK